MSKGAIKGYINAERGEGGRFIPKDTEAMVTVGVKVPSWVRAKLNTLPRHEKTKLMRDALIHLAEGISQDTAQVTSFTQN